MIVGERCRLCCRLTACLHGTANSLTTEPTGTTFPAQELERLAKVQMLKNVRVVRETKDTTLKHNDVPLTHLADLLKGASYLDDR